MLAAIGRLLRHLFGYRPIEIVEESQDKLVVGYGPLLTEFDRKKAEVTQRGKLVAMIPLVVDIHVHQPMSQATTPTWYVTVRVAGERFIEVGQTSDQEAAMHVAALIAALVGKPIKTHA